MTALAPELSRFLREHLPRDQRASPHTCDAYAYSFQLLVIFAARQLQKAPSQLEVEDIGVPMILSFLEHMNGIAATRLDPEMLDWRPSNRSSVSWNIACQLASISRFASGPSQ